VLVPVVQRSTHPDPIGMDGHLGMVVSVADVDCHVATMHPCGLNAATE